MFVNDIGTRKENQGLGSIKVVVLKDVHAQIN